MVDINEATIKELEEALENRRLKERDEKLKLEGKFNDAIQEQLEIALEAAKACNKIIEEARSAGCYYPFAQHDTLREFQAELANTGWEPERDAWNGSQKCY